MNPELWQQISNFGFPMVVSCFLLIRMEKVIASLVRAIQSLEKNLILKGVGK